MAKNIFSGLKDAKINADANYERAGHYLQLINRCKTGTSRKGKDFAVVEKTCVHVFDDKDGLGHRVGEDLSWMLMVDNDYFQGDLCKFIGAVMGISPEEVEDEHGPLIFEAEDDKSGHDQPFAGLVVECKNMEIQKKNSDGVFTKIKHVRQVPASELLETLAPEVIDRYFPNDVLKSMAEQEG